MSFGAAPAVLGICSKTCLTQAYATSGPGGILKICQSQASYLAEAPLHRILQPDHRVEEATLYLGEHAKAEDSET